MVLCWVCVCFVCLLCALVAIRAMDIDVVCEDVCTHLAFGLLCWIVWVCPRVSVCLCVLCARPGD